MKQSIIHISLFVKDYDGAINFYVNKLRFKIIEDTHLSDLKRWVLIQPPDFSGCCLLLAKAINKQQESSVGNQSEGRIFLFLNTDNFEKTYNAMLANGVVFVSEPIIETYGTVAVFKDLYGNLWDLIERNIWSYMTLRTCRANYNHYLCYL